MAVTRVYTCDHAFCSPRATVNGDLPSTWERRDVFGTDVHYCPKHKHNQQAVYDEANRLARAYAQAEYDCILARQEVIVARAKRDNPTVTVRGSYDYDEGTHRITLLAANYETRERLSGKTLREYQNYLLEHGMTSNV